MSLGDTFEDAAPAFDVLGRRWGRVTAAKFDGDNLSTHLETYRRTGVSSFFHFKLFNQPAYSQKKNVVWLQQLQGLRQEYAHRRFRLR